MLEKPQINQAMSNNKEEKRWQRKFLVHSFQSASVVLFEVE
jgi:hypothetical protein